MTDEGPGQADDTDEIDDPFARLDEEGPEGNPPGGDADAETPGSEDPLFTEAKTETGDRVETGVDDASDPRSVGVSDRGEADDPFDELGPATGESDADLDEAFERMDVGEVAEEDVWESLDEDAAGGLGPVGEFGDATSGTDATGAGLGGDFADAGRERVISKRTYCQQCPHFSAPPEVACGHEGTTILEAVGFDEFRVRNCPMVDDDDPTFDATREK
ncbi:hypothetical protein [Halorubrum salsamenti]|uniref:hypothetical protein n=1 Tax=Halorubrum salsamenti TaxID=2583990 RepID=UPI001F4F20C9|nr:hypothetical protein [Halorubrum salsamenti]